MTLFNTLRRLFRWLFRAPPDPEPDPPTSPIVRTPHADARLLDVAVYQTTALTDRLGRVPEEIVAQYYAQALTDAGYNVGITFGLDAVDLDDLASPETLAAFSADDRVSRHANVLLGDRDGGGIAYIGSGRSLDGLTWRGRYALAPAGNITHRVPVREHAPAHPDSPRLWKNVRAAVHELGHTLGGVHADRMTDPRWADYPGTEPYMGFYNIGARWMDSPPPERG